MDRQKEERSKAYSLVTKYKKTQSKKSSIFCLNFGRTSDFVLDFFAYILLRTEYMRDSFIRIALLGFEGDFKDTIGKVS